MRGRILSIASPGNGSGKTLLAETILRAHPGAFTAVKFTTVYRDGENCPRTETECACRSLHGPFTVLTDPAVVARDGTDTGRLHRAGAARTMWCLAAPSAHAEAWGHLRGDLLRRGEPLVTEGNRIVPILEPDALVVVMNPRLPRSRWKDDVWDLVARASLVVVNDPAPGDPAAAAALAEDAASRGAAPVILQDVAQPLARWPDRRLAAIAAAHARERSIQPAGP